MTKSEAERAIRAYLLDKFGPGAPQFECQEYSEVEQWIFWIDERDASSILHQDGRVEWAGTHWIDDGYARRKRELRARSDLQRAADHLHAVAADVVAWLNKSHYRGTAHARSLEQAVAEYANARKDDL